MFGKDFELNEQNMSIVEAIGRRMPGGFFIYKAVEPGELLYANNACFDIFGCSDIDEFRALTGYNFKGMVYPDDYPEILSSINKQINSGEGSLDYVEYRIVRKDGEIRWVDDYGHCAQSERYGSVYYVFISDITDKHKQEESDSALYSAVIEAFTNVYDSVWLINDITTQQFELYRVDNDLVHLMPAQEASKITRFSDACKFYSKLVLEEDRKNFLDAVAPETILKNTADKAIYSVPFRRVFGNNIRYYRLEFAKLDLRNGKFGIVAGFKDVDEETRREIKLRQARQQEMEERIALQDKLLKEQHQREQQNSMIVALSSDYRSVYYVNLDNDKTICYLDDKRFPKEHTVGDTFSYLNYFTKFADDHVAQQYREGYLKFIQPENIRCELMKHPIISYLFLEINGSQESYTMLKIAGVRHREDRTDNRVHAIGIGFCDIDAEMRESMSQQQTLASALSVAEEANKAKTTFLSNMSHEIRTPMNAIIGLNSLALRNENLDDATREYLEKIGGSARHLLGLINDILDMSRIESGRMVLRKEEFSFRNMLEQINTMVMSQCNEKGLKYECKVTGGVKDYYIGDDMKLKQVLINILSNAIKFTDAPGNILLSIEKTATYEEQSTLRFIIEDSGIGMDKSFIPKIFDSFTQEDSSRSNKYGSTGLGMAITKNIVELMNGTISVESEKGVGTKFTVVLTLKNSDHHGPTLNYVQLKDMRVLVVDDEEIAAEHARIVFDDVGIKSDICLSGKDALKMVEIAHAKHAPYNLVLIDWKMPDMDGVETARLIREKYDKETTIIILTSFSWDEIIDEALHAGVDSFLAKPLFASIVIDEFERIARKNNMNLYRERRRAELKGKRILLAEDVFINAEIMKKILGIKGMLVEHAENGKIALEMFGKSEQNYYNAILMDVRMPVMDGLEATTAIRALPRADAKKIPIIAMTANAFDEDVQRSLQAGMNAHLSKPVESEHLYKTLEELIWEKEN